MIDGIVDGSGATARVPVLQKAEVFRAVLDAGIAQARAGNVPIERDGEQVASGSDVEALIDDVEAQGVESR